MLWREFHPERINAILNDPVVRPDVSESVTGGMDIAQAVNNHSNVLLMGEYGGCFFFKLMSGIYEVHSQCLKPGRGAWIADFVQAAGDWMYTRTDAFEIVTRIPINHNGARTLAIHAGMKYEFTEPDGCVWRGERQDIECYSYRLQDWLASCESFEERGRQFHDFLHKEAIRLGVMEIGHDDQPTHNRYVGACLEMAKHGHAAKGVSVYNRWALMARHPVIQLLTVEPLAIRFDLGILRIVDGEMKVERAT